MRGANHRIFTSYKIGLQFLQLDFETILILCNLSNKGYIGVRVGGVAWQNIKFEIPLLAEQFFKK